MEVTTNGNIITLTRTFDAPKALVFSMFKDPHLKQWWGPSIYPVTFSEQDFRAGGSWHYCMTGPENDEAWGKAIYEEIDEPNKIVYRDYFSDAEGTLSTSMPVGLTTIMFEVHDGKTTIISTGEYESADDVTKLTEMGMIEGVRETWDKLAELVETK